jgi:ABC-type molybdate transport system substrate-binding protein
MLRILALLLALSATASAAELKVLSVGAVQPALGQIAERFKQEAGHNVTIQVDTAPGLTRRMASGETADVFIAPPNLVEDAARDSKVVGSTKAWLREWVSGLRHAAA